MHKANKDNKWVRSSVSVDALYVYVAAVFICDQYLCLGLCFSMNWFCFCMPHLMSRDYPT